MKHIIFRLFPIVLSGGVLGSLAVLIHQALGLFSIRHPWRCSLLSGAVLLALILLLDGPFSVAMLAVLHWAAFSGMAAAGRWIIRQFRPCPGRRFWSWVYRLSLLPLLCTVLVMAYGHRNMIHPVRTDYTIQTNKSIAADGYRVALLADLHYGAILDEEGLRQVCREISGEKVDLVILCGDIVEESTTRAEVDQVFSLLGGISTRYGVYFVYGNHDRCPYAQRPNYTQAELTAAITASGITILRDQVVEAAPGLILAGREDRTQSRRTVEQLLSPVSRNSFILMADHQPRELAAKAAWGVDLQVSGHTHAGQIFPLGYLSELAGINELNYGLREIQGMTAVVTSGLSGWGFPIRTQAHSEYVILHILPT